MGRSLCYLDLHLNTLKELSGPQWPVLTAQALSEKVALEAQLGA